MRFGIHVPRQRNLTSTARYAAGIGCESIQVFSGNPMSWTTGVLSERDRDGFVGTIRDAGIDPVVLHTPYLINIATPDRRHQSLSLKGLVAALLRASELQAGPVVVHAGNHMGRGAVPGLRRAVRLIDRALERVPDTAVLALENGAGRGTEIGVTMEELARLVAPFPPSRVGLILDTAHLWATGYDLRSPAGVDRLVADVARGPGLDRLWGLHGNDSAAELGSRRDRHALWSEGNMGRRGLRALVGCRNLSHLPFIFEIPGDTPESDKKRLASMRRLDRRLRGG